jgi:hypothetical protein
MADLVKVKRAELQKKRLELSIDELELRKLDLLAEIQRSEDTVKKTLAEIEVKSKEIDDLKKE